MRTVTAERKLNMTKHFTFEELTASDTAKKRGIDNTPDEAVTNNLKILANQLELIRVLLGNVPIVINSGYRSPKLNASVGGSKNSAHMSGFAVDFVAPKFGTPIEICKRIAESGLKFDQLIYEQTWVHISFDPRMRQDVLTYKNGSYTKGIV